MRKMDQQFLNIKIALDRMGTLLQEKGITFEDLLEGSSDIRTSLFEEMFGDIE
jgi:hypothetical protein